jgi:hypothetical protein
MRGVSIAWEILRKAAIEVGTPGEMKTSMKTKLLVSTILAASLLVAGCATKK